MYKIMRCVTYRTYCMDFIDDEKPYKPDYSDHHFDILNVEFSSSKDVIAYINKQFNRLQYFWEGDELKQQRYQISTNTTNDHGFYIFKVYYGYALHCVEEWQVFQA